MAKAFVADVKKCPKGLLAPEHFRETGGCKCILVDPESLAQMKERGGTWGAYQSQDLSSSTRGRIIFIKYGPGCTHETPPPHAHDGEHGLGWRFLYIGDVDFVSGTVKEKKHGG